MSFEAGFDTSAQLMESGIPEEIMRHEMNGDPVNVEEIVGVNPPMSMTDENGDDNAGSNFLFDDDSSDDEAKVTIGNIRKNTPYQKQSMSGKNKIDMDGQPTINGNMIYDLDLATMEDKPWQKPGADITDYFNYGFNEETWNSYCERQRKLRAEYGTQKEVNRVIISSININFNPQQSQQQQNQRGTNINYQSGRQLINVVGPDKPQKVNKLSIDFSRPPPSVQFPTDSANSSVVEEEGGSSPSPIASSTSPTVLVFDASVPPPNFNPNVPPPDFMRPATIPPVNLNIRPPMFNQQPMYAGFNQQTQQFGMAGGGPQNSQALTNKDFSSHSFDRHDSRERTHGGESSGNSDDEYNRRKRKKHSRSGSPRRHKTDRSRDYRDSKTSSSRGTKRRDDREKRRDRDDDYDRKRRKHDRTERSTVNRYEDDVPPPGVE